MINESPIYSTLFEEYDEDSQSQVQSILDNFLNNWLPEKQQQVKEGLESKNWENLRSHFHAIKGSAGGYGFLILTELAKDVENQLNEAEYEKLAPLIEEFNTICSRIYAGNKPS